MSEIVWEGPVILATNSYVRRIDVLGWSIRDRRTYDWEMSEEIFSGLAYLIIEQHLTEKSVTLADCPTGQRPETVFFYGETWESVSLDKSRWHQVGTYGRNHKKFLVLTDIDHRAGFLQQDVYRWLHTCLGKEVLTHQVPRDFSVITTFVETGETPQFEGRRLQIVEILRSMTPEKIIYGTPANTRYARRTEARQRAAEWGIDLEALAMEAGLSEVLTLPDAAPLTRAEHDARDFQRKLAEQPPIIVPPSIPARRISSIAPAIKARPYYESAEEDDELSGSMAAAFMAAGKQLTN